MAPAPILCVRLYKSGEGKKEPVQEANTVYISIMNQVPERARECEGEKEKE